MRIILALLSFLAAAPAEAGLCGDANTLRESSFTANFHDGFEQSIALPRASNGVVYDSQVLLHLSADGTTALQGFYEWPVQGVGFEYHLYRLEIQIGEGEDAQFIEQDYTAGCQTNPAEIWPGERRTLLPIPLALHANGSPRGTERVRVRFWGK